MQLRCPIEAYPRRQQVGDSPLREAMNARWHTELGQRLRRAAWWFVRANRDSPTVPQEAEVKFMGTAFEVLAAHPGLAKSTPIRDLVGDLLSFPWVERPSWRSKPSRNAPAAVQDWTTFQFWWNDFYRLRNAIEHEGHDTGDVPADSPRWDAFRHLLVATIVFPHLVQAVLSRDGAPLSGDDEIRGLQAVEGLLMQPGFRWNGTDDFKDLVSAAHRRTFDIAIAGVVRKHLPSALE